MKKIIHVDMDCFYAAVEIRDRPELKGLPVAVGGLSGNRGVICAANYEARKYGVRSALSTAIALKNCPSLILVPPDIKKYAEESGKIHEVFKRFTDAVEPLSLDEAFLDVSESGLFKGSATLMAEEIRKQILKETGLTASAGIAPNKFLAKIASDWKKPNGQFTISPPAVDDFIKELPVEKIFGVGKVTAKKMHLTGIKTCRDLQGLSLNELHAKFGSFGFSLYELSRGIDNRNVETSRERKSLSIERTFSEDSPSLESCMDIMPSLYKSFEKRSAGLSEKKPGKPGAPYTLFVKVKFNDFTSTTAEASFESICPENFNELLKRGFERKKLPVRLIGLGVRFRDDAAVKEQNQLYLFAG